MQDVGTKQGKHAMKSHLTNDLQTSLVFSQHTIWAHCASKHVGKDALLIHSNRAFYQESTWTSLHEQQVYPSPREFG